MTKTERLDTLCDIMAQIKKLDFTYEVDNYSFPKLIITKHPHSELEDQIKFEITIKQIK